MSKTSPSQFPGIGPSRVQIQTQSGCNGRCVFCPNEATIKARLPQGRMEPALYHKIIDELAELSPSRVSPYLMNEPLLDSRLPEFIGYATDKLPDTTTLVTTNGSVLTEDMARALVNSGLKRIKVSLQSLDPATNMGLMGDACDSNRVVQNVLGLKRIRDEAGTKTPDIRVSMIVTRRNQEEIERARRFWKHHGVRLVTSVLENRGGNMANIDELNPHEMKTCSCGCIRPSREMCILFNGDVVLCCVDWFRTAVVGNVARERIEDIWNGDRLREIREALQPGSASTPPTICANCTESAAPQAHRGWRALVRRLVPGA